MYLKRMDIKKFRCIKDLTIFFNEGVNIIVGENNSGKTAIIDALRICFSYGDQRRDIFVSPSDFYIDKNNPLSPIEDIVFNLHFKIKTPDKSGIFYDLLSVGDDGEEEPQLHFRFFLETKHGVERIRYRVWGGDNEGQVITPEVLDLFYHVYMGALRNAVRNLRPVRGNRLGQLYSNIQRDPEKRELLATKVTDLLDSDGDWQALINSGEQKVNEHLRETSIAGKEQRVNIDFLPMEFNKIVETLRIQVPIFSSEHIKDKSQQKYFELYQNGLGYNNLIFIAAVLGDLKQRREVEQDTYIALLIEEPEAHLHPQLQNIFFNYLRNLDKIGFQIFISSHSPTITSKAELNSLLVLQSQNNNIFSFAVNNSGLDEKNKKYLQKFLDVTKAHDERQLYLIPDDNYN